MQITLTIPDSIAASLQSGTQTDLGRIALESLALEGYRRGFLSRYLVQTMLGHTHRFETERWLYDHGARLHYSLDDLESDMKTMDQLLGEVTHDHRGRHIASEHPGVDRQNRIVAEVV